MILMIGYIINMDYESNQAKLRISCEFQKRVETNQFHISVDLLGVLSPYTFRRIVQQ